MKTIADLTIKTFSCFVVISLFIFTMFKLYESFKNPASIVHGYLVTLIIISSAITTIWLVYQAFIEIMNLRKAGDK